MADGQDKDTLVQEMNQLVTELKPVYEREKSRIEGENRPFDIMSWVAGTPDSRKYPAGPAYMVSSYNYEQFGSFITNTATTVTTKTSYMLF